MKTTENCSHRTQSNPTMDGSNPCLTLAWRDEPSGICAYIGAGSENAVKVNRKRRRLALNWLPRREAHLTKKESVHSLNPFVRA